jgi:hypothetical protein
MWARTGKWLAIAVKRALTTRAFPGGTARNENAQLCANLKCATLSFIRSPPMTAQSSLQSNWNASPGVNYQRHERASASTSVAASHCRRRHWRANAAT